MGKWNAAWRAWGWPCLAGAGIGLWFAGCEQAVPDRQEIPIVQPAPEAETRVARTMDTPERMGAVPREQAASVPQTPPAASLQWITPEGWIEETTSPLRVINLSVAAHPEVECFVTVLPGSAGGALDNYNRWRAQMQLDPVDEEHLERLPSVELLDQPGILVDLEGVYTGMRGERADSGYAMLGVIQSHPDGSIFVKMTGPADALAAERARFDAFVASIHVHAEGAPAHAHGHDHGHDHGHEHGETAGAAPPAAPVESTAPGAAGVLAWDAPAHWERQPDRAMREATFTAGEDGAIECYVTMLPGHAGGVADNLNRWRAQMKQPHLRPEEIEALPRLSILGVPAPYIEITGDYTGMTGPTFEGYAMLAAVAVLEDRVYFVRLTGPEEAALAEREHFKRFCESLQLNESP